ncbi:hypothetical protein ACFW9O_04100 [Streptomyces sp. NPDC059499]|uniref:hypothetical protein n=1 Tax=Streptomyces sp. NPDC059499 TaxID=3346852 RepID=UPI0036BEDF7C
MGTALALSGWPATARFVDVLTPVPVITPVGYVVGRFRSPRVPPGERGPGDILLEASGTSPTTSGRRS